MADSSVSDFIKVLGNRESSGDYSRVNTLGYTGLLQWGNDRLTDYNKASGNNYSMDQFKNSKEIQDKANTWHINDIDSYIDKRGYVNELGFDRDGLRAAAHLGGRGGMDAFVHGKERTDAYGTSTGDYYNEFSGLPPRMKNQSGYDEVPTLDEVNAAREGEVPPQDVDPIAAQLTGMLMNKLKGGPATPPPPLPTSGPVAPMPQRKPYEPTVLVRRKKEKES